MVIERGCEASPSVIATIAVAQPPRASWGDRAEVRELVLVGRAAGELGAQCACRAERAAGPARRDPDRAVPEPRALEVEAGRTDRCVGRQHDVVEANVEALGRGHADRWPGLGDRRNAGRIERDIEQQTAARCVGGDQRAIEPARTGGIALVTAHPPAPVRELGADPRVWRVRCPHSIETVPRRAPRLGEDGDRIEVPFRDARDR